MVTTHTLYMHVFPTTRIPNTHSPWFLQPMHVIEGHFVIARDMMATLAVL